MRLVNALVGEFADNVGFPTGMEGEIKGNSRNDRVEKGAMDFGSAIRVLRPPYRKH